MTQEEKARAYDEALEDMRVIYPNLKGDAKLAVEHAFPELAEGEDERIRKEIISALKFANDGGVYDKHIAYLEKQKEQKLTATINGEPIPTENYSVNIPLAEWSEEDEKIRRNLMSLLVNMRGDRITEETYQKYYPWLRDLRPSWKPSDDELAKKHLDGYCMGREDTMREMKDFIESHFNTNKAREGEDLTDLYRKEYAQPLCLRKGGVCTNPMRDCINCIPTLERFNTTSGTSTATLHGNTSATDGKEHNPSFTD